MLSICIPTFRQPEGIRRLLQSLAPQADPAIEIVIQDDSPDDLTKKIVEEFSAKLPIRYFGRHVYFEQMGAGERLAKKGEKGGIDRSIIFLTEAAAGEYVWWMGDDIVTEGGVARVMSALRTHPAITFLWTNHRPFDRKDTAIPLEADYFFQDREEVLTKIVGGLGFISVTVFRRDMALSGIEASKKFIGTAFVNLYLALHVLSEPGEYFILKEPAVINFPNKPEEVNENGFEVFGIYFAQIVLSFRKKFRRRDMKAMLTKNFGYVWRGVLVRWVTGYESPKGKRWPMFKLYWSYPEFWLAIVPLCLPLFVNRALYRLYKTFFSERTLRFRRAA